MIDLVQQRTKQQAQWLVNPPSQQHKERHPEKCELDAEIDCTSLGEFCRWLWFEEKCCLDEVEDSNSTIPRERYNRQENKAKPLFKMTSFTDKVYTFDELRDKH